MGRKKTPGLLNRKGIWHIDKKIFGRRISESTGSGSLQEAETYLARRIEGIRQAKIYGVRPKRTFREGAAKFLQENQRKASLNVDAIYIKVLDRFIGEISLDSIHMGSLQTYIEARQKEGVKARTINYGLQVVRRILMLAATEWLDEHGLTWLNTVPKIKSLSEIDRRKPHPLDPQEQAKLFNELPLHLRRMALFAVNTGCRDHEICTLRWEWETFIPELNCSVFIIPAWQVKNRQDRLVVLNQIAKHTIEEARGIHPNYVFTYHGKPISRILNSAWKNARIRAGLPHVRVHDLKHTFGRRLRAAGVSFEDRQDLLGHKNGRITTHYSNAELNNLIQAANKVCDVMTGPRLTLLRVNQQLAPAKVPQGNFRACVKVV